jgi:hypothetical protein
MDWKVPSTWALFIQKFKSTRNDEEKNGVLRTNGLTVDSVLDGICKLLRSDCDVHVKISATTLIEENVSYFVSDQSR